MELDDDDLRGLEAIEDNVDKLVTNGMNKKPGGN